MLNRRVTVLSFLAATLAVISVAQTEETREVEVKAIKLQIPESWTKEAPNNNLRLVQYAIKPAEGEDDGEFYVSAFGGDGGGVSANVSRWVKQFDADGRAVIVTQGKSTIGDYVLVDIKGTYNKSVGPPIRGETKPIPNSRLLGAIIAVKGEGNYFLKLTGGQKTIAKQVDSFRNSFKADKETEKPYEQ